MRSFQEAGIPIQKISKLRNLLEEGPPLGGKLTDVSNLKKTCIPFTHKTEIEKCMEEVKDQYIGCIHDGASRDGEAFAILFRWCDFNSKKELRIFTRLVCFDLIAASMTGDQIAKQLFQCICRKYQVEEDHFIAMMHDRVAANYLASRVLRQGFCGSFLDIGCFPHTFDHCGDHFVFPHLDIFNSAFTYLFESSYKSRGIWKLIMGKAVTIECSTRYQQCYSAALIVIVLMIDVCLCGNRWWSLYDVDEDVFHNFAQLPRFLMHLEAEDMAPSTVKKLKQFLPGIACKYTAYSIVANSPF